MNEHAPPRCTVPFHLCICRESNATECIENYHMVYPYAGVPISSDLGIYLEISKVIARKQLQKIHNELQKMDYFHIDSLFIENNINCDRLEKLKARKKLKNARQRERRSEVKIDKVIQHYEHVFEHYQSDLQMQIEKRRDQYLAEEYQADEEDISERVKNVIFNMALGYVKKSEKLDEGVKLIEDVLTLVRLLCKANSWTDIIFAIAVYVKLRNHTSLANQVINSSIVQYVQGLFSEQAQSGPEEYFQTCREVLDKYDAIKTSAIFAKLYKLCMYSMSLSLFERIGLTMDKCRYTLVEQEVIKSKYYMGPDFFHTLLDTVLFICERGYQCMKTGTMSPIFHSEKSYQQFFDKYDDVTLKFERLPVAEQFGISEHELISDLKDLIAKGTGIRDSGFEMSAKEKIIIKNMVSKLQLMEIDLCGKVLARSSRVAPFSVLLYAGSGIGKSSITNMLYEHSCKIRNLPNGEEYKFVLNPMAKYWDGFDSSMHTVIVDDAAFKKDTKCPTGDESVIQILQIVNPTPFCPDQADLSKKGRTPLRNHFTFITTNVKNLNAWHNFNNPSACQRRFPYILEPTVKPEYLGVSGMIDGSKTLQFDGDYPDFWTWKVSEVVPVEPDINKNQPGNCMYNVIMDNASLGEMLTWYNKAVEFHFEKQSNQIRCDKNAKLAVLCNTCKLPPSCCSCAIMQSNTTLYDDAVFQMNVLDVFWLCPKIVQFIIVVHFFARMLLGWCTGRDVGRIIVMLFDWLWYFFWNSMEYTTKKIMFHAYMKVRDASFWDRYIIIRMGKRFHREIGFSNFFVTLTGAIGVLYVVNDIRKLLLTPVPEEEQGAVASKPIPDGEERTNPWAKDQYVLTSFDVSRETLSSKGMDFNTFCDHIARNQVHFTISTSTQCIKTTAFCPGGQLYIFNEHILSCITDQRFAIKVTHNPDLQTVNQNAEYLVNRAEIGSDKSRDIAYIVLRNIPAKKDIVPYFAQPGLRGIHDGFFQTKNEDGTVKRLFSKRIERFDKVERQIHTCNMNEWRYYPHELTVKGDCGGLIITNTGKGPVIVGMHYLLVGGQTPSPYSAAVAIDCDYLLMLRNITKTTVFDGTPSLEAPGYSHKLSELHPKSVVRYVEQGNAIVYGSIVGFKMTPKSLVGPTLLNPVFKALGLVENFGKPVMSGWKPWRTAFLASACKPITMDESIIEICATSFLNDILSGLEPGWEKTVHIVDEFTAVNGANAVAGMEKLNRNTSAGAPFNKCKKFFLHPIPAQNDLPEPVEIDDIIRERIDRIDKCYRSGVRAKPVFTACLKDEPVSFKKIEAGKTRVFSAGPMDWTIWMRKHFLGVTRLIQNNKHLTECAVGLNAQSDEWGDLLRHLVKNESFGIVAGDFENFDKNLLSSIIIWSVDIMIEIASRSGNYESDDLLAMKVSAHDIAFCLTNFNGDLIEFMRSNPSGQMLTTFVNSFSNSIYMRYCYYILNPKHEVESFKNMVNLMTYGDDNIMGVSKQAPWFNHTTIQKVLSTCNINYTMADKSTESKPYIEIGQSGFLKRTWRYDEDIGNYVCPLEEKSIAKSLLIWTRSQSITAEAQMVAIMESASAEYFFYGKTIYKNVRNYILKVIHKHNLSIHLQRSSFPEWDVMRERIGDRLSNKGRVKGISTVDHKLYCNLVYNQSLHNLVDNMNFEQEFDFTLQGWITTSKLGPELYGPLNQNIALLNSYCRSRLDYSRFENGFNNIRHQGDPQSHSLVKIPVSSQNSQNCLNRIGVLLNSYQPPNNKKEIELKNMESDSEYCCFPLCTRYSKQCVVFCTHCVTEYLMNRPCMSCSFEEEPCALCKGFLPKIEENAEYQSSDMDLNPGNTPVIGIAEQITTTFGDANPGEYMDFKTSDTSLGEHLFTAPYELADFLKRPLIIQTYTWTDGNHIDQTFYPWYDYLNNTIIKNKIANYKFIRADLHLRVQVNAARFYYGLAKLCYQPMAGLQPASIRTNDYDSSLVSFSQRPHVNIYPSVVEGGDMTCPFIFTDNAHKLSTAVDFQTLGRCDLKSYTILENAGTAAAAGVTIQVMAWLENVKLGGSTTEAVMQSNVGVISGPASAISKVAASLSNVPVIGKFATATSIGAGAVGSIAKLFGWSNPPVITGTTPMHSDPFPGLASAHIGTPLAKLCLDPKNEVSVDNSIVGGPTEDELVLAKFCAKDSYLRSATWTAAQTPGTALLGAKVTPSLWIAAGSGAESYAVTPACLAAQCFKYWRGDIEFTIEVIASQFHAGRLVVEYDPSVTLGNTNLHQGQVLTWIMDISQGSKLTVRIPYTQVEPFLRTTDIANTTPVTNASVSPTSGFDNGTICVKVYTPQTCATASSDIYVLMYTKACDNIEFAYPKPVANTLSYFEFQSDVQSIGEIKKASCDVYLASFGERISSLRELMRRSVLFRTQKFYLSDGAPATGNVRGVYSVMSAYPASFGFDPLGYDTANKAAAGTAPFNYVNHTPMTWITPCFIGRRGGINWHFNTLSNVAIPHFNACVDNYTTRTAVSQKTIVDLDAGATESGVAYRSMLYLDAGWSGCNVRNALTQAGNSVYVPHNTSRKFMETRPEFTVEGLDSTGSKWISVRTEIATPYNSGNPYVLLNSYVAAGLDYNVSFFLNVPTIYRDATLPTPV